MNEDSKYSGKRKSGGMMFESLSKRDGGFDFHRNAQKKKENPVDLETGPRIVVVGVGGGGGNTVEHLINSGDLDDVKMAVLNTDMQDLSKSSCKHKIQIGSVATQGLGAGGNPENGAVAAEESMKEIMGVIEDAHMLFLICGEGGGTGTGTIPVVAKAAREAGILTIGVVTRPFTFEGKKRAAVADAGIAKLQETLDLLIVIPNDNVLRISDQSTVMSDAFKAVDDVAASLVRSFARLVKKIGLLNIDFADIKAALSGMQARGMVGVGEVEVDAGNGSGVLAAEKALLNPLLEEYSLYGARSVIMSIEMGRSVVIDDINGATLRVQEEIDEDESNPCKFVFGATYDDKLENKIRVTVIGALNEDSAKLMHQARNQRMSEEYIKSRSKNRDLEEDFMIGSEARRHAALNEDQEEFVDDELEEDWPQRSSAPEPQQDYISRPNAWWMPFGNNNNSVSSVRFVDEVPRRGSTSKHKPQKR